MDLLQREGKYSIPAGASKIQGVEFSGIVEDLGRRQKGDSVRAMKSSGWLKAAHMQI